MSKLVQEKVVLKPYEAVIIMKADTSEEKQKSLFQKNKQIIESFKGDIHHVDTWGKRRLANQIEKEKTGLYFHTTFKATSAVVAELERTMRINEDVLRYVHIALEEDTDLTKFVDGFRDTLAANQIRDKERAAERANKSPRQMRPSIG